MYEWANEWMNEWVNVWMNKMNEQILDMVDFTLKTTDSRAQNNSRSMTRQDDRSKQFLPWYS